MAVLTIRFDHEGPLDLGALAACLLGVQSLAGLGVEPTLTRGKLSPGRRVGLSAAKPGSTVLEFTEAAVTTAGVLAAVAPDALAWVPIGQALMDWCKFWLGKGAPPNAPKPEHAAAVRDILQPVVQSDAQAVTIIVNGNVHASISINLNRDQALSIHAKAEQAAQAIDPVFEPLTFRWNYFGMGLLGGGQPAPTTFETDALRLRMLDLHRDYIVEGRRIRDEDGNVVNLVTRLIS